MKEMALSVAGIVISIVGLAWTVYGVWSSSRLKTALLREKNLIREPLSKFMEIGCQYKATAINRKKEVNEAVIFALR